MLPVGPWILMCPIKSQGRGLSSLPWELTEGTVLVEGRVEDL